MKTLMLGMVKINQPRERPAKNGPMT